MTRSRFRGALSVAVVSSTLVACGDTQRIELSQSTNEVEQVTVRGDIGVVEVVPGTRVRIIQELNAPDGAVERVESLRGGHLVVETRCKTPLFCSVDTRILVPEGIPVHVELAQGEVWATGVGELDIELGSGMLDLDTTGPLRGHVGQGKVRAEVSADQLVRLAVGQGDIELLVPRTPWSIDVQAQDSQLLGVIRQGQAQGKLELVAPAGRVRVRATGVMPDSGSAPAP